MNRTMHISASSLLEAVIAIAIISICLSIGLSVFVKVTNVTPPVDFYTMDTKLKQAIAIKTDSVGLRSNLEFDFGLNSDPRIGANGILDNQLIEIRHQADSLTFTLLTFNTLER